MLSVVIPTLNAAATLEATVGSVRVEAPQAEMIVADAGSADGTPSLAEQLGARIVPGPRSRGEQLIRGARAARGDWLLFLHADTTLAPGWMAAAQTFMTKSGVLARAAAFRFALDDPAPSARRLECLVAWRCRMFGLPYGDQGLLIGRAFYDSLGGFKSLALMEDVDLVRRIGKRRLVLLDVAAVTSAERFRRDGYVRRSARNLACLGLYVLGVPTRFIARVYG